MRPLALLVIVTMLASACATAGAAGPPSLAAPTTSRPDRQVLRAYVQKLPAGARVRASLVTGKTVKGTLIDATDAGIVVQKRTRIPEPPVAIAIEQIRSVEIDAPGGGIGKAVAIGAAAGAGAALGVILLLAAMFSD
jgi:hypothetical protein